MLRSSKPNTIWERLGPLGAPDGNGIRLPEGFSCRIVARSGEEPVTGCGYRWHASPDGGACYDTQDGGWIYVSNSEMPDRQGGVGAMRFGKDGVVVDAYSILCKTSKNCAGGATPWQTWLSCEEVDRGQVWECYPFGTSKDAIERPALGRFQHEAAAVDASQGHIYLTEDERNGCFYRFTAAGQSNGRLNLEEGILEVAQVLGESSGIVVWHLIKDPNYGPGIRFPHARDLEGPRVCGFTTVLFISPQKATTVFGVMIPITSTFKSYMMVTTSRTPY